MDATYRSTPSARCNVCGRLLIQRDTLYGTEGEQLCPQCFEMEQIEARRLALRMQARRAAVAAALLAAGVGIATLGKHSEHPLLTWGSFALCVLLYVVSEVLSPRPFYFLLP